MSALNPAFWASIAQASPVGPRLQSDVSLVVALGQLSTREVSGMSSTGKVRAFA